MCSSGSRTTFRRLPLTFVASALRGSISIRCLKSILLTGASCAWNPLMVLMSACLKGLFTLSLRLESTAIVGTCPKAAAVVTCVSCMLSCNKVFHGHPRLGAGSLKDCMTHAYCRQLLGSCVIMLGPSSRLVAVQKIRVFFRNLLETVEHTPVAICSMILPF